MNQILSWLVFLGMIGIGFWVLLFGLQIVLYLGMVLFGIIASLWVAFERWLKKEDK